MHIVLRRIFPSKTECPTCRSTDWKPGGSSRSGSLLYRCCTACSRRYRVPAIAEEIDDGGAWSRIVPLG